MDTEQENKLIELIQKLECIGVAVLDITRTKGCVNLCLSIQGKKIIHDRFERCVNVFGDKDPLARAHGKNWELQWVVSAPANRLNVQLKLLNTDTAWWMDSQIDALVWLCRLGLTNEYTPENKKSFYPDLLLSVFSNEQELQKTYGKWLDDAIICNIPFGLNDPISTILLLQRINFYEWFVFFSENWLYTTEEHPSEIDQTFVAPSGGELTSTLSRALVTFQTAKEFLESLLAYQTQIDSNHWGHRTQMCIPRARFVSFHCCPLHCMMRAVHNFYSLWAEVFERKHNITQMKAKNDHMAPMVLSRVWVELLCYLESIDSSSLIFPPSFGGQSCKDIVRDYV